MSAFLEKYAKIAEVLIKLTTKPPKFFSPARENYLFVYGLLLRVLKK